MQVKFNIRNVKRVQDFLKSLPRGVVKVAIKALAEYIVGDNSHGLKKSEPYKYVTRKSAYGMTFFTEKQRRWFWANGGPDMIGNNRTGKSAEAWTFAPIEGAGVYRMKVTNNTTAAYFTRDDKGQARQPARVGWRKVSAVIAANMRGAIRHANAEVRKYIKSH